MFDRLVNRLGGDLGNLIRVGLETVYSDNSVESPVAVTHVPQLVLPTCLLGRIARVRMNTALRLRMVVVLLVRLHVIVMVERV